MANRSSWLRRRSVCAGGFIGPGNEKAARRRLLVDRYLMLDNHPRGDILLITGLSISRCPILRKESSCDSLFAHSRAPLERPPMHYQAPPQHGLRLLKEQLSFTNTQMARMFGVATGRQFHK